MGIDSGDDFFILMGDNMAMNKDAGELHMISGWKIEDDENDF